MKKWGRLGTVAVNLFIGLNVIAAFHAYKFTHFSKAGVKMEQIKLTLFEKAKLLFLGVDIPRPQNTKLPDHNFKTYYINSNVRLETWFIPADSTPRGTVIIFHGYTSNKSELINRSENFHNNGYNCLLVDFMGSGGSGGSSTTIGYFEAREVTDCFKFVADSLHEKNIFLLGSSLGAAAIMKSLNDTPLKPKAIIIECPFATMYQTVVARFNMLHVPPVPMASLLLFWGGTENGFWGFGHNPVEYAKNVRVPVLLQWGAKDDRVAREETEAIFKNLNEPKTLKIYYNSGHDNYLATARADWEKTTLDFVNQYNQ
jgi:uncharacterized protein